MAILDPEAMKLSLTVCATFATTLVTIGKSFHAGINLLNTRIDQLSKSITELDKNLAVQTAIFNRYISKEK